MDHAILNRLLQLRVEAFSEIPEKVAFLTGRPPLERTCSSTKEQGYAGAFA
jgi:hypothetical protein